MTAGAHESFAIDSELPDFTVDYNPTQVLPHYFLRYNEDPGRLNRAPERYPNQILFVEDII